MWPNWQGQTVLIVASGPSAAGALLRDFKGRCRAIAINESWRLCEWADVLYGCDGAWWRARDGVPGFEGAKLCYEARACREFGLGRVEIERHCDRILTDRVGCVGDGGNSGFQALNLAVQFGAKRVILIGFDMQLDHGLHWHGRHPQGLNNPSENNIARWRQSIDGAAFVLKRLGVTVLNASPISALEAYPKMSLHRALEAA
jgi:hypothetical protein